METSEKDSFLFVEILTLEVLWSEKGLFVAGIPHNTVQCCAD